jgi:DNA-binding transcriptional LysR family regulator
MDKLRALQYFVAAAQQRSFSGAARELGVSVPAVAKLITALEKSLPASLFVRGPQGLALTTDGERYLDSCQPLLESLADADEAVSVAGDRPRGLLTVGAPALLLQNCLGPMLPRFHARFPDIEIDLRIANRTADTEAGAIEVFVLIGWHDAPEYVQKTIAQSRYVVLASPSYWSAHGMPQEPPDLERHQCFSFRNPHGTLLDLWEFQRDTKVESVKVSGWLASSHRNLLVDAALAGEGVVRASDLVVGGEMRTGKLIPALADWNALDAPPVTTLYLPKHRRTPRVRAFAEYAAEIFRTLEADREGKISVAPQRPDWYWTHRGRASVAARRRR